jgi:hypothetical protein
MRDRARNMRALLLDAMRSKMARMADPFSLIFKMLEPNVERSCWAQVQAGWLSLPHKRSSSTTTFEKTPGR